MPVGDPRPPGREPTAVSGLRASVLERWGGVPLLTAPFAVTLKLYCFLWPLWWVLGIEQILLPVFIGWEFLRSLVVRRGRIPLIPLDGTVVVATLLALWWLVPFFWLEAGHRALFFKGMATAWSQAMLLALFVTEVRSRRDWAQAASALAALAGWVSLGCLVYGLGLWRGRFLSVVGHMLPQSALEESAFLHSIGVRSFGVEPAIGLFGWRISSFALGFSALGMLCLVLVPLTVWRGATTKGGSRLWAAVVTGGLLVGLVFAQSRVAYIAAAAGLGAAALLRFWTTAEPYLRRRVALAGLVVGVLGVGLFHQEIHRLGEELLAETRPGSLQVRQKVYKETLTLLPEHWIAGLGTPRQIQGLPTVYSAGTHSSYLGMLFQHGVVGLALYLALWLTIWRKVLRNLGHAVRQGLRSGPFWLAVAVAFLAFNIREATDTWWWDQLVTITVWSLWGLVLSAHRYQGTGADRPREAPADDGDAPSREALVARQDHRPGGRHLSAAVALLVLIPYVSLLVPFSLGLMLQAGLLAALLVVIAGWGLGAGGLVGFAPKRIPAPIVWGLALWAGAALWGASMGLVHGNPIRNVLSQSVSLLFLPIGFLAFALHGSFRGRTLTRGLTWGALGALILHLAGLAIPALVAPGRAEGFRFILRNNLPVPGSLVMIFLLVVGHLLARRSSERWELVGLGASLLLLIGGMSRGAWIASILGLVVLTVMPATRPSRNKLLVLVIGALALVGSIHLLEAWSDRQLVSVVRETFEAEHAQSARGGEPGIGEQGGFQRVEPRGEKDHPVPVIWNQPAPFPLLVLRGWIQGPSGEILTLALHARDETGERIGDRLTLVAGEDDWVSFHWLVPLPPETAEIRLLAASRPSSAPWLIDEIEILAAPGSLVGALSQLTHRLGATVTGIRAPAADGGLRYRLTETRAVLTDWSRTGWLEKLTGSGLGATFDFQSYTWDRDGNAIFSEEASYIHNFYLFLAYKLGLAGIVLLAGLSLIVGWTALVSWRIGAEAWFTSVAVACWVAYLLWSITSPEIYDFRVAPLWGGLIAASLHEVQRSTDCCAGSANHDRLPLP